MLIAIVFAISILWICHNQMQTLEQNKHIFRTSIGNVERRFTEKSNDTLSDSAKLMKKKLYSDQKKLSVTIFTFIGDGQIHAPHDNSNGKIFR